MKRTYISGPMTGIPELNYPVFMTKAAELRAQGYIVINPAELIQSNMLTPALSPEQEKEYWAHCMRIDLTWLLTCDRIVMLDGWTRSRGATLEHHIAVALGMEVVECGKAVVS